MSGRKCRIYKRVDLSELLESTFSQDTNLIPVDDVGRHRQCPATKFPDIGGDCFNSRKRARREYDVGTLASAAQRKGSSEPWSGTANDDNPIFEEHGLRFRKPARHYLPKRCVGPHCSCPQ